MLYENNGSFSEREQKQVQQQQVPKIRYDSVLAGFRLVPKIKQQKSKAPSDGSTCISRARSSSPSLTQVQQLNEDHGRSKSRCSGMVRINNPCMLTYSTNQFHINVHKLKGGTFNHAASERRYDYSEKFQYSSDIDPDKCYYMTHRRPAQCTQFLTRKVNKKRSAPYKISNSRMNYLCKKWSRMPTAKQHYINQCKVEFGWLGRSLDMVDVPKIVTNIKNQAGDAIEVIHKKQEAMFHATIDREGYFSKNKFIKSID